ncbi:MAG: TadG family pilus assembly protein [Myxococcota bacterium]
MIFVLMLFAAMAVDIGVVRLAISQDQDVADAASQAALLTLRTSGSESVAREAAEHVVGMNLVAGGIPQLQDIQFGVWDNGAFSPSNVPNAVRVTTGRDVPMAIARLWGWHVRPVSRSSVSAARALHVVLVMDITNSWSQSNFANARAAAVAFYDHIDAVAGPDDKIGMVVFTGQYGVEHTPLMSLEDADAVHVRDNWNQLRTASKAGTPANNSNGCNVYSGTKLNDFSNPYNGCFPNMWREYIDESGTDHTTGLEMARAMFSENDDPTVYRAVLVLTDGDPNGTGAHTQRAAAHYDETRWRYYKTGVRRSTNQVISDSQSLSATMWDEREINIWAVSFVASATWLNDVVQGDGYFTRTSSSSALVAIFEDVAESLPVAIVQ